VNDAERVASYRRVMVCRGGKHSEGCPGGLSMAKLGTASRSGVLRFLGLLAVVVVANSWFGGVSEGRSAVTGQVPRAVAVRAEHKDVGRMRNGRSARVAPLHARTSVVPFNGSLFAWPSRGTPTYQRAVRMARHGDPEARMFVGGQTDINPFDVQ
jgi:hypothetical protein